MKTITYKTDLCVVGGGLAGLCCAVAAARHGIKVVIVQDRPVLGGNSSSEIRMWVGGARGKDNRETGIIEEIFLDNFYQNPTHKYALWDSVLYEKVMCEENITLLLNTSCMNADTEHNEITSITCWQSNAETFHKIESTYFADCSGDSILAPLSGAHYRYGREAKSDFNETIPPDVADRQTMGMSCLFQIRQTDHKTEFHPPKWAYKYESDDDLPETVHHNGDNFWWIETGGTGDCIHDTDACRDELLKICYGVWDHMKNYGNHDVDNWELEWIGFLPGKRESRRYVGQYTVTQNDVEAGGRFDDIVAYAGWSMDDHFPAGFYHRGSHPTIYHPAPSPWGLPLRCMISENIKNLVFAGRNISVTHAALSSSRVMATCAILGQALGTAVAAAVKNGIRVESVNVDELRQTLMDDDCFIPGHRRNVPELTKGAQCNCEILRNGLERGEENVWIGHNGDVAEYILNSKQYVNEIRLVFDSNLNRNYYNMPCNYPLLQPKFKLPDTLIREYLIEIFEDDKITQTLHITDNHQRLVKHKIGRKTDKVRFTPVKTNGCETFRLFEFELH